VRIAKGALDGPVTIEENGVTFLVDVLGGQKTGWFYDQRPARALVAKLAQDRRVLDLYAYTGGFALQAAAHGAAEAVLVDGSGPALALAAKAAALNGVSDRCVTVESEVFGDLTRRAQRSERFAIVVADPPAFVRSRKGLKSGLKGYRKLSRLAAQLVEPGGLLFMASCSHLVGPLDLAIEIRRGLIAAKRGGRILAAGGPGADHPVHAFLPESAYLSWQLLELD
jgi:23S rRNA (cytosine1962-C5)-methyltransferase